MIALCSYSLTAKINAETLSEKCYKRSAKALNIQTIRSHIPRFISIPQCPTLCKKFIVKIKIRLSFRVNVNLDMLAL